MKSVIITAAVLAATSANADTVVKSYIEDFYSNYTVEVPYTTQECSIVEVPVYGTVKKDNAAEGAFLGMLLGGLAGKGLTGDDGGAAAGAVMGGIIGADKGSGTKRTVVGYRKEKQCQDVVRYSTKTERVYDYSVVNFTTDGVEYTLTFKK